MDTSTYSPLILAGGWCLLFIRVRAIFAPKKLHHFRSAKIGGSEYMIPQFGSSFSIRDSRPRTPVIESSQIHCLLIDIKDLEWNGQCADSNVVTDELGSSSNGAQSISLRHGFLRFPRNVPGLKAVWSNAPHLQGRGLCVFPSSATSCEIYRRISKGQYRKTRNAWARAGYRPHRSERMKETTRASTMSTSNSHDGSWRNLATIARSTHLWGESEEQHQRA
jgi:hypothetical protein